MCKTETSKYSCQIFQCVTVLQSQNPCPITLTVSQSLPHHTYSFTSPAPSHLQSHNPCPITLTVSQALPYHTYSLTSPTLLHLQSHKPCPITLTVSQALPHHTYSLTSPALSHLQSHKPCPITLTVTRLQSHCQAVLCWVVHAQRSQFDSRHTNGVSVLTIMDHISSANTCFKI